VDIGRVMPEAWVAARAGAVYAFADGRGRGAVGELKGKGFDEVTVVSVPETPFGKKVKKLVIPGAAKASTRPAVPQVFYLEDMLKDFRLSDLSGVDGKRVSILRLAAAPDAEAAVFAGAKEFLKANEVPFLVLETGGVAKGENSHAVAKRIANMLRSAHSAGYKCYHAAGESQWVDDDDAPTFSDYARSMALNPERLQLFCELDRGLAFHTSKLTYKAFTSARRTIQHDIIPAVNEARSAASSAAAENWPIVKKSLEDAREAVVATLDDVATAIEDYAAPPPPARAPAQPQYAAPRAAAPAQYAAQTAAQTEYAAQAAYAGQVAPRYAQPVAAAH